MSSIIEILKIFNSDYRSKFRTSSISLAHLCYDLNLRPCIVKSLNIEYMERSFFRALKGLRQGDGDGEIV